jgi:hypothetical protein
LKYITKKYFLFNKKYLLYYKSFFNASFSKNKKLKIVKIKKIKKTNFNFLLPVFLNNDFIYNLFFKPYNMLFYFFYYSNVKFFQSIYLLTSKYFFFKVNQKIKNLNIFKLLKLKFFFCSLQYKIYKKNFYFKKIKFLNYKLKNKFFFLQN